MELTTPAVAFLDRVAALRDELKSARDRLAERKLAMDRNCRLLDVAQQIIDVADLLG